MSDHLKPLCGILDNVLDRLSECESKLGIATVYPNGAPRASSSASAVIANGHANGSAAPAPVAVEDGDDGEIPPRLAAYDEHMARALTPLTDACTALGSEMEGVGSSIRDTWNGVRVVVELGTKYKRPADPPSAIQPHLKPCQDAMSSIRSARLDRKFDWHLKAIMEMLGCVSWVVTSPPPAPSTFVKDTIGASDFWANKIRKEYKGKGDEGEAHVKFCDTMKELVMDLSRYLKEYHLSGLAWNPHGKDFSEAKVGEGPGSGSGGNGASSKAATPAPAKAPAAAAPPAAAGGGAGIFAELKKKQTGDGTSAASGLKKVTRDQQTWRKEFKKPTEGTPQPAATPKPAASAGPKFGAAKKPLGPPKCEYQDRGCKWNVENQTKDTCEGGVCKVDVTDPKQQVYIYKCENVTIQITGKLKSVILDSCKKVGVVFDTAISACEVVNCKSVQVQATNVCPSFSIDKTDGIVVHLSKEGIDTSSFVTSKSSEMNGKFSF